MIDRAYPELIGQLETHGITVVSLQPVTIEGMYQYWQVLGRLLGQERQAAEMGETHRNRVETEVTGGFLPGSTINRW